MKIYRKKEYTVVQGIQRNRFKWAAELSPQIVKGGEAKTRVSAEAAAKRAVDEHIKDYNRRRGIGRRAWYARARQVAEQQA